MVDKDPGASTSRHDPGPWVAPPDDAGKDTGAADAPHPAQPDPSTTSVQWAGVPNIEVTPVTPSGGDGAAPARPEVADFRVDIAALRGTLDQLLTNARDFSAAHNDLQAEAQHADTNPFFWGQNVRRHQSGPIVQRFGSSEWPADEPVQNAAKEFAPVIAELQKAALDQITAATYRMGQFMSGVSQSVNAYASADVAAKAPDAPRQADPGDIDY